MSLDKVVTRGWHYLPFLDLKKKVNEKIGKQVKRGIGNKRGASIDLRHAIDKIPYHRIMTMNHH